MDPAMLDVVRQFDRAKFDERPLEAKPDERLSNFDFDPDHWDAKHATARGTPAKLVSQTAYTSTLAPGKPETTEQRSETSTPSSDRLGRKVPRRQLLVAIGAVSCALIIGTGVGYLLV